MPVISQTLSTNGLRTTSEKSISLYAIRKLIEYSLKNAVALALFTPTVVEILLLARCYHPPSGVQEEKELKRFS